MWNPCPRKISCALWCTFSSRRTLISPFGKDVGGEDCAHGRAPTLALIPRRFPRFEAFLAMRGSNVTLGDIGAMPVRLLGLSTADARGLSKEA